MSGDEDGSTYSIEKLDPVTWKPQAVLTLHPLLRDGSKQATHTFWGYPWDIRTVLLQSETGSAPKLLSADPACLPSEAVKRSKLPSAVVFFEGEPSQGEPSSAFVRALGAAQYRTLAELMAFGVAGPPCSKPNTPKP